MVDIVITEFMHKQSVADLARDFEVHYEPTLGMDPVALRKFLRGALALVIRDRTVIDVPLIAQAYQLRVVAQVGLPSDNIDMGSCDAHGIAVVRTPDAMADAVGEYVIAAALVLTRGVFFSNRDMLTGQWPRGLLMGREIGGRTLGLVGLDFGARSAAARARALGMSVIGWDPLLKDSHPVWQDIERREFDDVLASADVVSVHLPPRRELQGKLGTLALNRIKAGAVLIAVGASGVVDEAAVANMLSVGKLRGAALDGFVTEPLTIETAAVFAGVPNLILTPRVADLTLESHLRSSEAVVEKIRSALKR
ncbi:(S)-sulfolactate dehydrogenase [Kaistia hirudinis]|uniref:(S)-sulfolactate dehydrogenase n=1 Tax=Kaistia hirudinis TaxID=1293440 RepID=A0A840ATA1_9HYPH|nr:NAD(P)-dependent oxidoreductase [Kaistia hirudinis]MBB3931586.1 (S)-sulfolactate dehydrogenase [Kaistia hirudinis]MBN9016222.1 3-phosphoglycerate dehydrogenase [Hyphomicrobiales bacterium]